MAADSLACAGGRKFRTRKLYRVRGALIGMSGAMDGIPMFGRWYEEGADLDDRPNGIEGYALVMDSSGLYRYESNCYPIPIIDEFATGGSGGDVAMGALLFGQTPEEAVALACEVDLHTGPPVVVERL